MKAIGGNYGSGARLFLWRKSDGTPFPVSCGSVIRVTFSDIIYPTACELMYDPFTGGGGEAGKVYWKIRSDNPNGTFDLPCASPGPNQFYLPSGWVPAYSWRNGTPGDCSSTPYPWLGVTVNSDMNMGSPDPVITLTYGLTSAGDLAVFRAAIGYGGLRDGVTVTNSYTTDRVNTSLGMQKRCYGGTATLSLICP